VTAALRWGAALTWLPALLVLRRRLELIARAEHELRAPVTLLALTCEQLASDDATAQHARRLEVQLDRLRAGLRDLEAARCGRRPATDPEVIELRSFAGAAIAPWRQLLVRDGREASVAWEGGRAPLRIDRGRLSQALGNLLANAAEHGKGDIELRGRRTPGGFRIEILNRRWKRRRRPRRDRGRGLAIAEQAAREIGGRLQVRSQKGSVVAALELSDESSTGAAFPA
jgi:signal transduction histidine kinase